ncbi:short-chain dehydrogenase [Diaporthe amygdali]|uniref:short-chain dehydrogenase n=1 Tax=Phomopsis amygdali TaxID=1214568 RepID=UPI0022FE8653|nr:short-chain dehydrogenase [Diaporthe amygdali]KAJ0115186.1 short-chain dehydrogenase [Diaporthe amygdali]
MTQFSSQTTAEEICDAFTAQIKGKTFLITGTSANGIGAKSATTLAKYSPAQIILVSRSKPKVDPVIEEIKSTDSSVSVKFVPCELSDQDAVRKAAETILSDAEIKKIDVVVNNAGVMAIPEYTVDKAGNEMQFSANHLGHFLLTNLIMPKIRAAGAGARIINLTSLGHRIGPFRFSDPKFSNGKEYDPWSAYGQSKTANVLFTVELARRLKPHNIQSFAVHPGLILSTGLGDHMDFESQIPILMAAVEKNNPGLGWSSFGHPKSDSQGSASTLFAALDPGMESETGAYVLDCGVGEALGYATDLENARKLWAYSEELVGQKFDV